MLPELEVLKGFGTKEPFVQKYGNNCRKFAKPPEKSEKIYQIFEIKLKTNVIEV